MENQHTCVWLKLTHWLKVGSVWMTFTANKAVFFVHLAKPLMTFPLQILLSFLFLISPHLSSHPNPVTSFINISALAPLSFLSHTCFFSPSTLLHMSMLPFTHIFSALFPHVSQVDWPLNIIITDSCMNKYNRLFSFLLQLKHMVWSLREVWFHLKRTGERVGAFGWGPARPTPYLWGWSDKTHVVLHFL